LKIGGFINLGVLIRGRPKMTLSSAEKIKTTEKHNIIYGRNRNENEKDNLFSAENEK